LDSDLNTVHQLTIKDLGIIPNTKIVVSDFDKLKEWLAYEIQILLDHDFEKLLNMLYRIDVNEQKAKEAFADLNPSMKLAELIIAREIKKVETRKKYGNNS
jgi:hypothetical protein